jgi:DNA-binding protein WhiA
LSFNSEIKDYLLNIQEKNLCCRNAYNDGFEGREFNSECPKDTGCFIRGIFIKSGFISPPDANFNLTITLSEDYVFYVNALLEEAGLEAKVGKRKNKYILYYKESEKIEDFLAFIGASKYSLQIMEQKVINELRGNANRLRNAETANLDRTAKAAAEQCEAISLIITRKEYQKLPAELKECADLRLANPDMSLDELRMQFSSPISKSGLNHRLKKLIELAERLK